MGHHKPIIGITGGIGAGKSTVARAFEALGAKVIDSDALAHEELAEPEVIRELRSWLGDAICNDAGATNRRALAKIVFDDPAALQRLEDLLYPRIHRRRREMIAEANADPAIRAIVLDAPKLYEAGVDKECDAVIFVDADERVRRARVAAERGWKGEELARRESRQIPLDIKRKKADYVVANHSTIDELRPELERILFSVLTKSSGRSE